MQPKLTRIAAGALALIAIAAGSSAQAQATIDQNKALAGSVTPGDAPGFPVTLSVPGAYKLTGNLVVPASANGIEITTDGVTLDLNGFRVSSNGVCTRDSASYAVNCTATQGFGIVAVPSLVSTVVRNGTVRGFQTGVALEGGIAESLIVKHNVYGLFFNGLTAASRATGIVAEMNGAGVYLQWGMVERSVATANGVGFGGSGPNKVSVIESQANANGIGFTKTAVRANRVIDNKTDLDSTVAF